MWPIKKRFCVLWMREVNTSEVAMAYIGESVACIGGVRSQEDDSRVFSSQEVLFCGFSDSVGLWEVPCVCVCARTRVHTR